MQVGSNSSGSKLIEMVISQTGDRNLESRHFNRTRTAAWMAFSTGEGVRAIGQEPGSDKNKLAESVISSEVLPRQHAVSS